MVNMKKTHLLSFIVLLTIGMSYMTNARASKSPLNPQKVAAINLFWHGIGQDTFTALDKTKISFAANLKQPQRPYIVIVPGRSESYLKYQELMYDFDQLGFDSVIIDHRGQGLSERLTTNKKQGYVESFDDYAKDLQQLLAEIIPHNFPARAHTPYMLAHSMGGAIALRYLQQYPHEIKAVVLTSPMLGIDSGKAPFWLAKALVNTGATINPWFSEQPWYFVGQNDGNTSSFADNQLMHSPERYQRFQALYHENPNIQLGGVTFRWLAEAISANEKIFNNIAQLKLPVLVLQAGEDSIVDNQAQNEFCKQLHAINHLSCPQGEVIKFEGAFHELFFELDKYRDIAIANTLAWFEKHQ